MFRWMLIPLFVLLVAPAFAAVEVIDLPAVPEARYDLTWDMKAATLPPVLVDIAVETAAQRGYALKIEKSRAVWQPAAAGQAPVTAQLTLEAGKQYSFSLKRRPGTVALLMNHRLVLCAPAPQAPTGTIKFRTVGAGVTIGADKDTLNEARYQAVGNLNFGDDFMREDTVATPSGWRDDITWRVAYFRKANPAADPPKDPKTNAPVSNPWQLSRYSVRETSTNGFWFLYRGVGPSWVVPSTDKFYPTWDRYYLQTAIWTEYESEVGLVAAYQDPNNYLVFRWRPKNPRENKELNRAELVAVIDGKQKLLAKSDHGFDPVQWYKIRLNLGWQRVQVLVDDQLLMDANNPGSVEGRVGLYASGSANPGRPKVDEITATMYAIKEDGKTINDAQDAMRSSSCVYFDDVKVGDWVSLNDHSENFGYPSNSDGNWKINGETILAQSDGHWLTGYTDWGSYTASVKMQVKESASAGIMFHMDTADNGYAWAIAPDGQALYSVAKGVAQARLDQKDIRLASGDWVDLRVEANGPYIAMYCNNQRVMDYYDLARATGRCGLFSSAANVAFRGFSVSQSEFKSNAVEIHKGFEKDAWLVTWASPESEWYPSFTPKAYVTPAGRPHTGGNGVGAAAPLPTNEKGLYWHKGGHYHDLSVTIPLFAQTESSRKAVDVAQLVSGQILHLASNYNADTGYKVLLTVKNGAGNAHFTKGTEVIGDYPFPLTALSQLVFERCGSYLVMKSQTLAAEGATARVTGSQKVFSYRDPAPIQAEMIGFTVTSPDLGAARLTIESNRLQDTFEKSPVNWISESGIWRVMSRYSCQPQWNWFGGFGPMTPTVWHKYYLEGDQNVEAYMGVKMAYDNAAEEYSRRYRDLNVTICADGSHINTGYTVIRHGKPLDTPITMLLRNGVVVKSSKEPAHLLPGNSAGHRQWFATRIEKHGAEIKVFLDNKLVPQLTFVDPEPLTGGYVGLWTINNGMMIGRVNISADRMTLGSPRAASPLAVQEELAPLATPKVNVNGSPLDIATFEDGVNGWKERPGLTGKIIRERADDGTGTPNTYLKVVNSFPAGDCSVNATTTARDLLKTPILHFDYNFDADAQVNLYVRCADVWYEFLLTGEPSTDKNVYAASSIPALADGKWHFVHVDLGKLMRDAITKKTGAAPTDIKAQEIVFADWSATPDMRFYGFCKNPGETALRFDNFSLMPSGQLKLAWSAADGFTIWKTKLDDLAVSLPTAETTDKQLDLTPNNKLRFFHILGLDAAGKAGATLHIPISAG